MCTLRAHQVHNLYTSVQTLLYSHSTKQLLGNAISTSSIFRKIWGDLMHILALSRNNRANCDFHILMQYYCIKSYVARY